MPKLEKKPSALIFALLDPDPHSENGSGSKELIESGSNPWFQTMEPQSYLRIKGAKQKSLPMHKNYSNRVNTFFNC
jgi:hypothetical protein